MNNNSKKIINDLEDKKIYINYPSSAILEKIKKFSIKTEVNKFKITGKIECKESLNIWKIFDKIFIIGPVWDSDTEYFSYKNSLNSVKKYLENVSKNQDFLYFTTNENIKLEKNILIIKNLDFDCILYNKVSSSIQTWLDLKDNHIVIIELDYDKLHHFAILIECIQIKMTKSLSSKIILQEIGCLSSFFKNLNTVERYKRYFQNLVNKKPEEAEILKLHQVIISNYPKLENFNDATIHFYIYKNKKIIKLINNKDGGELIYKDNFYIVLTDINCELSGDSTLCLKFEIDNQENTIFEFPLNIFYYKQGLYRYKKEDIMTIYNFPNDFKLDLVFLDTHKIENKIFTENNLIGGIKNINEMIKNKMNEEIYMKLSDQGFDKIISTFCGLMNYTEEESKNFINLLEIKGYRKITNVKPFKNTILDFNSEIRSTKIETFNKNSTIQVENKEGFYRNIQNREYKIIDFIIDEDYPKEIIKIKPKIKFKKKTDFKNKEDLTYKSIRHLHLVPITNKDESIFKDLGTVNYELDIEKFKKFFCVLNSKSNLEAKSKSHNNMTIDPKRLFLVSLALKHLSKKNINPENIYEMLKTKSKDIYIQDLLCLEKVFPTYEETYLLVTSDYNKLVLEEKIMLQYSKLVEVKKIVKISLFEQKFFDEIFLLEDLLEKFKFTFDKLIESQDLKIILRIFLDIGNLINHDFSTRSRKISGFKLSSLNLFLEYKGKEDFSLFQYFMECYDFTEIIINLQKDFKYLNIIRKEEYKKFKDKINYLIEKYKENLEIFSTLKNDKNTFSNFLFFVSEKLEDIKNKYEECRKRLNIIKKMFDEGDQKNINEILDVIEHLITKMKKYNQN
ncbi:formin-like protein [Vairimorpha necatrix]|uniref:Formin-like protein n=1 Tax=Vairimorpha necatrix TaxID=6039 RepID=A0AAX4JDR5_9MICR